MAKINTKQKIMRLEGIPYKDGTADPADGQSGGGEGADVTIGSFVARLLASGGSKDPVRAFVLAGRFYGDAEVDLTAEETVFVKGVVSAAEEVMPYVKGQILTMLDPSSAKKEE